MMIYENYKLQNSSIKKNKKKKKKKKKVNTFYKIFLKK
jgi:hypothetical protein